MIIKMVMALKLGKMVVNMKDNIDEELNMVKENMNGLIKVVIQESGRTIRWTGLEFMMLMMVGNMLVSG